uniref:Uncharacterized protein n=1 Tax=Arundo donax TaxID=35708 RepID=A0A0A8Z5S8_ARUDO
MCRSNVTRSACLILEIFFS